MGESDGELDQLFQLGLASSTTPPAGVPKRSRFTGGFWRSTPITSGRSIIWG